jgi:hypothetical protein
MVSGKVKRLKPMDSKESENNLFFFFFFFCVFMKESENNLNLNRMSGSHSHM